ncbi:hypothetical protein FRX31_011898 [Thalictrum thalictroides]|uniref:Uncharacterized protein n=1 Tax=Thalictrum thalictroides TaxID=46969 RepID=A0A7J6WQY4_THATH|nr:hypothetical protein FRX31_011898 [Thalictrum thalictroides]
MDDMDNPEDVLFKEGKFARRPFSAGQSIIVAKLDMDALYTSLSSSLLLVLQIYEPLRRQYGRDADACICDAITHYCHQAMNELWNRLRAVAMTYDKTTFTNIFSSQAPSIFNFEFPQFFATLLSSIGPLYISGTLGNSMIIYAPGQHQKYFGRLKQQKIDCSKAMRFQEALHRSNILLGKIQTDGVKGSYFTTCGRVNMDSDIFNILGAFHPSQYTHEDIIMAMLFGDFGAHDNPFEDLSISIGFVDDKETVKTFMASKDPQLKGASPTGPTRHIGGTYAINYFGLAPASNIPVIERGQGIFVLGRGCNRHNKTCLAHAISHYEFVQILRHRILPTSVVTAVNTGIERN